MLIASRRAVTDENQASAASPLWRRVVPFVLAGGLITYVFSRIDWGTFVDRIASLNYAGFLAFQVAFVFALLSADVFATVFVYRSVAKVSFRDLVIVRSASYLPSVLNHHIGQAWVTYLVSRVYGVPLKRVVGATLFGYVTWGGCILLLGAVSLAAAGYAITWLAIPLGSGVAYLVLLGIKPARLARNSVLAPLFDAGPVGHVKAMLMRLPHLGVLFIGTWVPFLFFGVDLPFGAALATLPIIIVAVALPLTPMGLGTRDALAAELLDAYVTVGATPEDRIATLAAATTTVAVTLTVLDAAIGLVMTRPASRLIGRMNDAAASPTSVRDSEEAPERSEAKPESGSC